MGGALPHSALLPTMLSCLSRVFRFSAGYNAVLGVNVCDDALPNLHFTSEVGLNQLAFMRVYPHSGHHVYAYA